MQFAHVSRHARLAVLVAAASVVAAHGLRAEHQAGDYRAPPLGTEFFVSDTGWFRVVEALPDAVVTENASKVRVTWAAGLVPRDLSPEARARLTRLFPLAPGAHTEYDVTAGSRSWHHEISVVAGDELPVGNRSIPVLRVTRHEKANPPSDYEGEITVWYAPEFGFPLKLAYRHIAGESRNLNGWQVVRILPPGSVDGVWRLDLGCSDTSYVRLPRVTVRDGVVATRVAKPNARSAVDSDLRLSRTGDQIELKGTMMNAGGDALVIAARGSLVGQSVNGTGTINTRTGCAFSGERQ